MKIKTFQALTMQDAIRAIKEDLGSDAVILSSKRVRKGGHLFGLFGRSMIEVERTFWTAGSAWRSSTSHASSSSEPKRSGPGRRRLRLRASRKDAASIARPT